MFRRASGIKCNDTSVLNDAVKLAKCVKENSRDLSYTVATIEKVMSIYAESGDPGPFLTVLGSLLMSSVDMTLTTVVNVLSRQYTELPPELLQIFANIVGSVSIIRRASETGVRLPKPVVSSLVSSMGCYDLMSLLYMFHERAPDKVVLLEFIKKALKSPWCMGLREEAIKLLGQALLYRTVSVEDIKEVFRDTKVRIVIKRKNGVTVSVKMYIGNEVVGDENSPYVMDFVMAAVKSGLISM